MTVRELKDALENATDEMVVEIAHEGISGDARSASVWENVFVISE